MKILLLTDNFYPETNAAARRCFSHAKIWVNLGAEVTVLSTAPNDSSGTLIPPYKNRLVQKECVDGINIVRLKSFIFANSGFFLRILDYVSFAFVSFLYGLFCRFDIVVSTSPQFFTSFTGFALSVLRRKPWVLEIRDLWPDSIVELGAMNKGFSFRLLKRFEKLFYRKADLLIAVTQGIKNHLELNTRSPVLIALNGAEETTFEPDPSFYNDLKRRFGDFNKVICYAGTIGMAHDLEVLLPVFARVPNIAFIVAGDGACLNSFLRKVDFLGLRNVFYLGRLGNQQLSSVYQYSDFGLVHLKDTTLFQSALPSKIFELSAYALPLLAGIRGEAKELIEKHQTGLVFEPCNVDSFLGVLEKVMRLPDEKFNAAAIAKNFTRKNQAEKIFNALTILHEKR